MGWIANLGQQLGQQAATGALGMGMGLLLEGHNDRRQIKQQQKLQDMQIAGQKDMTRFNMAQQYDMWLKTNYGAQKEQMTKAGLNPGLLYGMSGGGGTTTGSAGGAVGGAQAPSGGREMIDSMGIQMQAAQLSLLDAQRKNIEADTQNKLGDAANKPLVGKNLNADTENKLVQNELLMVQSEIAGKTQNMQIAMVNTALRKITAEMHMQETQQKITAETADTTIEKAKRDLAQTVAITELTRAQKVATDKGIQKTVEEIEKIKQEVQNMKDYFQLDDFIEREKVRLMDKGINVALISSTLGTILNFATRGRK